MAALATSKASAAAGPHLGAAYPIASPRKRSVKPQAETVAEPHHHTAARKRLSDWGGAFEPRRVKVTALAATAPTAVISPPVSSSAMGSASTGRRIVVGADPSS